MTKLIMKFVPLLPKSETYSLDRVEVSVEEARKLKLCLLAGIKV